ncbi:hypothetical protein [Providencia huaxiensis]|uniref:hypothetical protein n=1 Tax=Providencia huaxiensis TaxID=2027290 RepID=UPI003F7D0430
MVMWSAPHGAAIPNTGFIAELSIHEKRGQNAGKKAIGESSPPRSLMMATRSF